MLLIDEFLKECRNLDSSEGGKIIGRVVKKEFNQLLRRNFSEKSNDRILELQLALEKDQPGNWVMYDKLFTEDREFNQGHFAEAFRDQHLKEREEFMSYLDECITEECAEGTEEVNVLEAKAGIVKASPNLDTDIVKEYLKRGFGLNDDQLLNPEFLLKKISVRQFMKTTRMGSLPKRLKSTQPGKGKLKRTALVIATARRLSNSGIM